MTQEISNTSQPGVEATILIDLSGQIRNTGFIVAIIAALILVTVIYHPAVTDDDLFQTTYTSTIARKLIVQDDTQLQAVFKANLGAFDTPYDSIAKAYLRESDQDNKTRSLLNFLNTKKEVQRQYLLLLVEDEDIRNTVHEYLTDNKARSETFSLPVFEVKASRSSVLFYLTISFATLHGYYVVKHRYLLNIRSRFQSLNVLPDPSLLTATANDLLALNGFLRFVVCCLQETVLWILPIVVLVVVICFCSVNAASGGSVQLIVGAVFCLAEMGFAMGVQINHAALKRSQWAVLFGNKKV